MSTRAKRTIELDPKTGIVREDGTGSLSFFEDDEGEGLYSGVILLEGKAVRVRELTSAEKEQYNAMDEAARAHFRAASEATNDPANAAAELEAWQQETVAAQNWVLQRCIAAWELTRPDGKSVPCTNENKLKLRPTHKAFLCDCLVQRSSIGRDVSAFLSGS